MAFSCYQCSESAQQMGVLIHKIERDIHNDLQNALVCLTHKCLTLFYVKIKQIREFSLQIIHEPIEISANGFFTINFSLIGGMAASTVTYLVILIQFQLSQKPATNSTAT